ncbi:glutathione S-transferase protein [Ostertagia ostertagi]
MVEIFVSKIGIGRDVCFENQRGGAMDNRAPREVWNNFKNNALSPCLAEYEQKLKGKKHLVGSKISLADIALIEMLTRFQSCYDSFYLAHFPVLKQYCERFETLPHMRPYVQSRPDTHF